jgi:polyferredoxin
MIFLVVFLMLAVGGRWACGWLCPLGILEELIFKIPFPKKYRELPGEQYLRKVKYILFALLVILIPVIFLPNRESWKGGFLFLKLFGFSTVFILSLFIYRPFCKYLCPFGVFLGFFNKISPFRYQVDSSCNHCGLCRRTCGMGLAPHAEPNSMECIRCGKCLKKCPKKALHKRKTAPGDGAR